MRGWLADRLRPLHHRLWPFGRKRIDPGIVDRDGRTLEHWRHQFAGSEHVIECSDMRLLGRDHEPDVFTGPGRIRFDKDGIRFELYGNAADGPAAFRKYLAAKENPFEILDQFRLEATDYRGNVWSGGWTEIDFFTDHDHGWPLSGELQGLSTRTSGFFVSRNPGVEMLLMPPLDLPMDEAMETSTRIGGEAVRWSRGAGRQRVGALGTEIIFELDPSEKALWITAGASERLQPVLAERWLAEPLRIMLGALIYPRLIARNFGDGTADVTFLPAPTRRTPSVFGLMQPFVANSYPTRGKEFWQLYVEILTMIGNSRTEHGYPDLQYHEVTRLYEELIQTQRASRWIMSMTLASTIESLANSLMSDADKVAEYAADAIQKLGDHLRAWDGDQQLRARMLGSLDFAAKRSVLSFMKKLAREGKVERSHVETWKTLRNSVMHGELTVPWSTEEGEQHLRELVALTHSLTRLRVAKG